MRKLCWLPATLLSIPLAYCYWNMRYIPTTWRDCARNALTFWRSL